MFRESLVRNKDGFTVNMPVAVAASNMFNSANGLTEISLNAPILSEAGSFAFNCENLALVGKIVAPQLRHAQDMFSGCNKLVQAIDFQIPANADMRGAFEGTPVTDVYGEDGEYLLAFLEK